MTRQTTEEYTMQGTVAFRERFACSIAEACEAASLSRSKMTKLLDGGEVQDRKVGKRRLVVVSSLRRFIEAPDVAAQA